MPCSSLSRVQHRSTEQQVVTTDYNHESHEIVRFFCASFKAIHTCSLLKLIFKRIFSVLLELHLKDFLFYSTVYCNHPSLYSTSKSTNIYFIYFT
jgi:hypothetical protein